MERKVILAHKGKQHESLGASCDWSCRALAPTTVPFNLGYSMILTYLLLLAYQLHLLTSLHCQSK